MDEGVALLAVAKDAQRLFEQQPPADKRRLLNIVLSNSTSRNGELHATFRQPFNLIAETAGADPGDDGGGGPNLPTFCVAEGVGFEPTVPLRARRFSRPVP